MDATDWPYRPGELTAVPVSGGYLRLVDGRGVNVMTLFAADPNRVEAAARLLADAARLLRVDAAAGRVA